MDSSVCTATSDGARDTSLSNLAANIPSSAAGGVLAAMTTASVTPESSRISIHTPSASSGKITSRSAADTQKLAPCSARRKSA